jgi:tetratricopeptide (TPR) repeat protein
MMRLRMLAALALLSAAAAACSEKPRATVDAASSATASAGSDAQLPANARAALTKPAGATDADRAVSGAQDVVRRDMEKLDAWVALGHAWLRKARASNDHALMVNADACASVVFARDPNHGAAADLRGLFLAARHEWADARQLAERITGRHPGDVTAWGHLTDALIELGRYDEAKDSVEKMIALGPSARSAAQRRASRIQWLHGDVARARQSLSDATDDDSLVQAATISWHEGAYDAADAGFDQALERRADLPPALAGKGRVAMARGEWARAAELFARAYDKGPSLETAWLLGDAREAAGDAKGAEEAYALVAKDAASDARTYSLFLSARKDRSKEQYSEALRLASEVHVKRFDVYTEDALAWALFRAGMLETAKTSLGRARRLHTPDALLFFHEGAIRIAAGDVKKGKELLEKALATNGAFDWRGAKEARELLRK